MASSADIALIGYDGSEGAATAIRGSEAGAERVAAEGVEHARAAGFDPAPAAVRASPNAWRTLLAKADEVDASVVVLGSRGLGAVKSALRGSVSSGTLHHSRRPVLVAPAHSTDTPNGPSVVGFDGSEPARGAVSAAAELLSVKKVVITTVWIPYTTVTAAAATGAPAGMVSGGVEQLDREVAERARRTAENGARLASEHGLQASAEATEATSNASAALLHFAREQRAAALVVGSVLVVPPPAT
jgi:nucleotide-binding universal stress UspA family protein